MHGARILSGYARIRLLAKNKYYPYRGFRPRFTFNSGMQLSRPTGLEPAWLPPMYELYVAGQG